MGTLHYGANAATLRLHDHALAHVQAAVTHKLGLGERFLLSWVNPAERSSGRNTIWLEPSVALLFRYDSRTPPVIDEELVDLLVAAANTAGGLILPDSTEDGAD